jgi:hypothetical protein
MLIGDPVSLQGASEVVAGELAAPGLRTGRLVWGFGCQGPSFDQSRP